LFEQINGSFANGKLLDKIISEFRQYDLQKQISDDIKSKFGNLVWDASIVLKNDNGFYTIVTPIVNDKNAVTSLLFFYQRDSIHTSFKLIDRQTFQNKLGVYGNKETTQFTKSSLKGLFNSEDKYIASIKGGTSYNNQSTFGVIVSWVCWSYDWAYTNPDGSYSYVTTGTQCSYSILYDGLSFQNIDSADSGNMGGGDGGGGNSSDNQPQENACTTQCFNELNNLASNSQTISETVSFDVSDISTTTKYKKPKWKCLKGWDGWDLYSQEIGVIKLITIPNNFNAPNNTWMWQSLVHGNISLEGSPTPGVSISYSQGVGTPSFTPESAVNGPVLYASMALDFSVTYSLLCNCPPFSILIQPVSKSYTSYSEFWKANP
jgi:hypothetical protein